MATISHLLQLLQPLAMARSTLLQLSWYTPRALISTMRAVYLSIRYDALKQSRSAVYTSEDQLVHLWLPLENQFFS